jgi:hypothetical protein
MLDILLAIFFWISGTADISTPQIVQKNTDFHASAPVEIPVYLEPAERRNLPEKFEVNFSKAIPREIETLTNKNSSKVWDLHPVFKLPPDFRHALSTPKTVKGIYMTGYSLSSKKKRDEIFKLLKNTELNSVVIDFQDPDGYLMFPVKDKELQKIELSEISFSRKKFRGILSELQKAGIYTIARITTFQDEGSVAAFPDLALKNKWQNDWKNYNGLGWLDMTNSDAWEIPAKKALEAAEIGFDEIQFDYVRFPSDGRLSLISYANLEEKKKVQDNLRGIKILLS